MFAPAAELARRTEKLRDSLSDQQRALNALDELGDSLARRANASTRSHQAAVRTELRRRVRGVASRFSEALQRHGEQQKRRRRAQALLVGDRNSNKNDGDFFLFCLF